MATNLQIRKATRKKLKVRLALMGASGSGKTLSSLLIAKGLGDKILMVDTENRSAENYVGHSLVDFDFDVISLEAPYSVEKYMEAIKLAEDSGYDVVILDSITHAWAGIGGLLEVQGKITESSKSGNSYTAWRQVTPMHNKFIDAMVFSKIHLIATMRSKTEHILQPGDNGRLVPTKVGMAPIQREGMEYEFSTVFDLNTNNLAVVTKDRTGLFNGYMEVPTMAVGEKLKTWSDSGEEYIDSKAEQVKQALIAIDLADSLESLKKIFDDNKELYQNADFIAAKDAKKAKLEKGVK